LVGVVLFVNLCFIDWVKDYEFDFVVLLLGVGGVVIEVKGG